MADLTYISTNVQDGLTFDDLVGNLLSYRVEQWGFTEQDYTQIASQFGVGSNDLYYLPAGNYRLTNVPNSVLGDTSGNTYSSVNLYVFEDGATKKMIYTLGTKERFYAEKTSAGFSTTWEDITNTGGDGADLVLLEVGASAPSDTNKLWVDTSKLSSDDEVSLKYYDGSKWVSYTVNGVMLQTVYDTKGLKKDPYEAVLDALQEFIGDYTNFLRHKANELTLIHLASDERDYYENYMVTSEKLAEIFAVGGDLYNEMSEFITSKTAEITKIDTNEEALLSVKKEYDSHLYGAVSYNAISNDSTEWAAVCYGNDKFVALSIPSYNNGGRSVSSSSDETVCYAAYSYDGYTWNVFDVSEIQFDCSSICYTGKYFIAAPWGNMYYAYSSDGLAWTISVLPGYCSIVKICYGNGIIVAADSSQGILYSTDGFTWDLATINENSEIATRISVGTNQYWNSVCYGKDKFVAIAASGYFAYSSDGITWTSFWRDYYSRCDVCYGNNIFFACGEQIGSYSTDGIVWTDADAPGGEYIAFGNGVFLVAFQNSRIIYSYDGVYWEVGGELNPDNQYGPIIYGKELFLVLTNTYSGSGSGGNPMASIDSDLMVITTLIDSNNLDALPHINAEHTEWWDSKAEVRHSHNLDGNVGISGENISSSGNIFPFDRISTEAKERTYKIDDLSILDTTPSTEDLKDIYHNGNLLYTEDSIGNTEWWKIIDNSKFGRIMWNCDRISSTNRDWRSVCYGNDKFVAVARSTNYFAYSLDGITWNESTISSESRYWQTVCYGKDKFVAIANNSTIFAYSLDGITWTESTISSTRSWWSVCYGNDKFVATTNGDTSVAYSDDGINWTERTISDTIRNWQSVCYGKDKFVAVSQYSTDYRNGFAYSLDGINWSEIIVGSTIRYWASVCYGNDKFVATSSTNYFAYSLDGINWTESMISDTSRNWSSVCYGNDKFIAIAHGSNYAYSSDGITWTEDTISSISRQWISVCYGKDKFVAVAYDSNSYFASSAPAYTQGIKLFSSNISELPFENLENLPTTIEGYGITDMASSTDVENLSATVKTDLYYQHTPISGELAMSNFNTATDTIYVGIQKSLNTTGGGTTNYPMSTEHSKLDLIVYGSQAADTTHVNVSKMNCEAACVEGLGWTEGPIISRQWTSACYGNGKFVAVCQSNIFAYSYDGINWTESTISSRTWNSVCYGNDKFVVVARSNYFAYSYDGITWNESTISSTSRCWTSVCYGEDKFVAVSQTNSYFAYSLDGITWIESIISGMRRYWDSMCYSKNKFVVVTSQDTNYFAYSYDGINWTESTISSTTRVWISVCYGNDKFVAVASSSNYFAYSYDGITWTESTISSNSRTWQSVCYGNDKFVAVGYNSNVFAYAYGSLSTPTSDVGFSEISTEIPYTNYFNTLYSTDESNPRWASDGLGAMVSCPLSTTEQQLLRGTYTIGENTYDVDVSYKNGTGVIFNVRIDKAIKSMQSMCDVMNENQMVAYSLLEKHAKTVAENTQIPVAIEYNLPNNISGDSVCYGNGKFVAAGYTIYYSYDGITWVRATGAMANWYSVCYGNGKFVAVVYDKTAYSSDGITWTDGTIPSYNWYYVYYGNNKFIATGGNTRVFVYSIDGINWTEITLTISTGPVCYGNDKFVMVSFASQIDLNTFAYSSDGITWTESTISSNSRRWQSVCYGKDKFVAVATQTNYFAYSSDGITWTESTISDTSRDWMSVCYGNGKFVAISGGYGSSNVFAYSSNGITWTESTISDTSRDWRSVCYGKDKFVAVAHDSNTFASIYT